MTDYRHATCPVCDTPLLGQPHAHGRPTWLRAVTVIAAIAAVLWLGTSTPQLPCAETKAVCDALEDQ